MLYLGFGIEDTEKTKTKRGWRQRRKNVAKLATVLVKTPFFSSSSSSSMDPPLAKPAGKVRPQ
jgi:hypothetical protein